jgi:hypothetical protein
LACIGIEEHHCIGTVQAWIDSTCVPVAFASASLEVLAAVVEAFAASITSPVEVGVVLLVALFLSLDALRAIEFD